MNKPRKVKPEDMTILPHISQEPESTDVLGMYTGMAWDGDDPVQDQDDL